ncbi:DNA polymerase IV [Alteromonas sediminis]|uniref:DNA polymerase IV n=1 Tax=Alteromonas sediminis TaxID=2259342 RepID=A0A3N5ZA80_9ALTE|nr:DNA polymerase IV [Alteromonas sediminis]RPJ66278.1 DNA polymerase IV [Alteromonas sediminis]
MGSNVDVDAAIARKFIHIDMDCFYAAVEMRDDPKLKDVPIAIGGSSKQRGVISTCNYPARKFGVRSAMATAYALRLCPDLVLVKGRMEKYIEESRRIRKIFEDYTDIIEPLSLDEAYLDVTHCSLHENSATLIANDIRQRIYKETQLTASAGVAPCKFVAKIASDENKPNGICVISPANLDAFVRQLDLKKIPGVGKVTLQKLHRMGLYTCQDVRNFPKERFIRSFGKFGKVLWERSHGVDNRELTVSRERKSIGVERTLNEDITTYEQCDSVLSGLINKLQSRCDNHFSRNEKPTSRIVSHAVKLKFSDFQLTTVEHRRAVFDRGFFSQLLVEAFERAKGRSIRLLGVSVGLAPLEPLQQLALPLEDNND